MSCCGQITTIRAPIEMNAQSDVLKVIIIKFIGLRENTIEILSKLLSMYFMSSKMLCKTHKTNIKFTIILLATFCSFFSSLILDKI